VAGLDTQIGATDGVGGLPGHPPVGTMRPRPPARRMCWSRPGRTMR